MEKRDKPFLLIKCADFYIEWGFVKFQIENGGNNVSAVGFVDLFLRFSFALMKHNGKSPRAESAEDSTSSQERRRRGEGRKHTRWMLPKQLNCTIVVQVNLFFASPSPHL